MVVISTSNWRDLPVSCNCNLDLEVKIAGDWSNWQPEPCQKADNGVWKIDIPLATGTYEYKYIINGAWHHNPNEETIQNCFGSLNNILKIYSTGWKFEEPLTFEDEKKRGVISLACDDELIVCGIAGWGGDAKVYDIATQKIKFELKCNKLKDMPEPFSWDNVQVALGKYVIATLSSNDHTVSIYGRRNGALLYQEKHHGKMVDVCGIEVTDDYVLTGASDGSMFFMENVHGEWMITHKAEENKDAIFHISADGNHAATGHRRGIKLWDLENRALIKSVTMGGAAMLTFNYPCAFAIGAHLWNGVQVWDMEKGCLIRHVLKDEKGYRAIHSNGRLLTFCENVNSWVSGTDDDRKLKLQVYDVRQLGDPKVSTEDLWKNPFEYPGDYLSKHVTAASNSSSLIVDNRSEKFDIIKFEKE